MDCAIVEIVIKLDIVFHLDIVQVGRRGTILKVGFTMVDFTDLSFCRVHLIEITLHRNHCDLEL